MSLAARVAASEPLIRWNWIADHTDDIWERTVQHVTLTVISLSIGFVISLVFSAIAVRWPRTYGPITWATGVLYTIPSLALLPLLVPITGLGTTTAVIALTSYTLLILIRNIVAGIDGVPEDARDAATGMGYTARQRFFEVELPLAVPTIVAGLRIASVTVIGLVTVAALVGSGGYGAFITDGLQRAFPTPIILGGALSVLLAVIFDVGFVVAGRLLAPWSTGESEGNEP